MLVLPLHGPAARPRRPAALDLDEHIQPRVFTLARVRALIRRGDITDMKTIVGLDMVTDREPKDERSNGRGTV